MLLVQFYVFSLNSSPGVHASQLFLLIQKKNINCPLDRLQYKKTKVFLRFK